MKLFPSLSGNANRHISKATLMTAFICVLMSMLTLVYASYAWFTFSRTITASGIELSVRAPNNIMISSDNVTFSESVTLSFAAQHYSLLPASTYTATDGSIYETKSASVSGAAGDAALFSHVITGLTYNTSPVNSEGYYIDVPLYFKTDAEDNVNLYLNNTASDGFIATSITAAGSVKLPKIIRVAFLNSDGTGYAADATALGASFPILAIDHQTVSVIKEIGGDGKVTAGGRIAPNYLTFDAAGLTNVPVVSVHSGTVASTKVRIWMEGEDQNCISEVGGKKFSISLRFDVKD